MFSLKCLILLISLFVLSCTSIKLSEREIDEEFGIKSFTLIKPFYLIFFWECSIFGEVKEKRTSILKKSEFIDEKNLISFHQYQYFELGDKCSPDKDIRVYNFLDVGSSVELVSVRDRLDATAWVWDIEGYAVVKGRRKFFRLELPYRENGSLRGALAEVFAISK